MREDDPENPYTLTGRQVVMLFAFILGIASFAFAMFAKVAPEVFDEPVDSQSVCPLNAPPPARARPRPVRAENAAPA